MDDQLTIRDLLESYEEITVDKEVRNGVFLVSMFGKQFVFFAPSENEPASKARVFLYNDLGLDFPHVMLQEITISDSKDLPDGMYRWICLYEQESIVNSIVSFDDKIFDAVDRLIKLLSMNEVEKEREFQKEFNFYWNSNSVSGKEFAIYLKSDDVFAEMDTYHGESNIRVIDRKTKLSDIDSRDKGERKWIHHLENDAFFIPIEDCRGILPPHRGYSWTGQVIKNIVYAPQIEHISSDTFQKMKSLIPKTQDIILVFGMQLELSNIVFAAKIKCNNKRGQTLLEKLLEDVVSVEPLHTTRKDYVYLNEQIGNDIGLLKKKVLLIGAGSLGSYVAFELVKNGASNIKIFDKDKLQDENILRWAYGGFGKGIHKVTAISWLLNWLHPEIMVETMSENIKEEVLVEEVSTTDLIIFTIGNSDEQLMLNRALKKADCSVPVVFAWLEAGGINSHILVVNYQESGCFECLYTDETGQAVNNRSRKNSNNIEDKGTIRNGCGGTRAAYGTTILLRTTAALLDTVRSIMSNEINESVLMDISPNAVRVSDIRFPMEACVCCGYSE